MAHLGVEMAAPFVHWMKVLKRRTREVRQVETAQGAETARNTIIDAIMFSHLIYEVDTCRVPET